jgi:uncharacterized ferredoxin-like protein
MRSDLSLDVVETFRLLLKARTAVWVTCLFCGYKACQKMRKAAQEREKPNTPWLQMFFMNRSKPAA